MGEVWLAHHDDLAAQFAVKSIRPELVRDKDLSRFEREVSLLQSLRHRNIIRIVDHSSDPARPGYAMEFCPGGTIAETIHANADSGSLLDYFWQAADGLEYLHSQQPPIVHRDLKPANMLIGADERLKLSDFGLSKVIGKTDLTSTSSNWGTPGFSPPEQWMDFAAVDARADLYSLAATFYYLSVRKIYSPIDSLQEVKSAALRILFSKLLVVDPGNRLSSVASMRESWNESLDQVTPNEYGRLSRDARLAKLEGVLVRCEHAAEDDIDTPIAAAGFLEAALQAEHDDLVLQVIEPLNQRVQARVTLMIRQME